MLKVGVRSLYGCEFGGEIILTSGQPGELALDAFALGGRCRLHASGGGPRLCHRHDGSNSGVGHVDACS